MQILAMAQSAALGAVVGAAALAIIGFNWLGWVTDDTMAQAAQLRAEAAVIAALSPICVQKFRQEAGANESLMKLKRVSIWQQANFISKGGWATMPGSGAPNLDVAKACAKILTDAKT